MAERPIEQLTLREKFTAGERLVRDLIEHLEQSFVPKVNELNKLVRQNGGEQRNSAQDAAVRTQVAAVLGSEDFSQTIYVKLHEYLAAIEEGSSRALEEA